MYERHGLLFSANKWPATYLCESVHKNWDPVWVLLTVVNLGERLVAKWAEISVVWTVVLKVVWTEILWAASMAFVTGASKVARMDQSMELPQAVSWAAPKAA